MPGAKELAGTENRSIRLFNVPGRLADVPQEEVAGGWETCGPDSLVGFSAVAYYFGRQIEATQHVPVGLIHASYGGSGVKAWISGRALADDPQFEGVREQAAPNGRKGGSGSCPDEAEDRTLRSGAGQGQTRRHPAAGPAARAGRQTVEPFPAYTMACSRRSSSTASAAIWYQGEADVSRAGDYQSLFAGLIHSWRARMGQGDFPFLFVQLAPFMKIVDQPQDSQWARLRERS